MPFPVVYTVRLVIRLSWVGWYRISCYVVCRQTAITHILNRTIIFYSSRGVNMQISLWQIGVGVAIVIITFRVFDWLCNFAVRTVSRHHVLDRRLDTVRQLVRTSLVVRYTDAKAVRAELVRRGFGHVFGDLYTEFAAAKIPMLDAVIYFDRHVRLPNVMFRMFENQMVLVLPAGSFVITPDRIEILPSPKAAI